jgi:PST family polysaccharide transporter
LVRVLGIEKFGAISMALAVANYFIIIVDFGFTLTSTRSISIHKNNPQEVSKIFSETFFAQLFLGTIAIILLTLLINTVPRFSSEKVLFFNTTLQLLAQVLLPIWFFQGIEKMQFIAWFNFVSKAILLGLLFLIIKSPSDYIYVPIMYSAGNLFTGVISLYIILNKFKIKLTIPSFILLFKKVRESFPVFISTFSITAYINSNIVFLGFYSNDRVVGQFGIAEKAITIIKQLLVIYSQAIYPQVCQLSQKGILQLKSFFKTYYIPFLIAIIIFCSGIFIFADLITLILSGTKNNEITFLIRSLIICLNIPFNQTILAYNLKKQHMVISITATVANILLNVIIVPLYKSTGTILCIILTELFVTMALICYVQFIHKKQVLSV